LIFLLIFGLYLVLVAWTGVYYARSNRNLETFILGGRRLGPWVAAISAEASDMSGWLFIGLPAAAYAGGFSILWAVIGCAAGTLFNWIVIAPRLYRLSLKTGALTLPDFLEARFGGRGGRELRLLAAAVVLIFFSTYISAQFIAVGKIFETCFADIRTPWGSVSIGYVEGLALGCGVILFYTLTGGFLSVAMTDLVQGTIMVIALVVLPLVGIVEMGGPGRLWDAMGAASEGGRLLCLGGNASGPAFWLGVVAGGLSWGLGYPGQPHILVRFMAVRDAKTIPFSALISVCWVLVALYGAMLAGFLGIGLLGRGLEDPDRVLPLLAGRLLPEWMTAIVIAGAVAAVMSTVDSQILVAVSAVVEDVYVKILGGDGGSRRAVWIGRAVGLLLGGAGFLMAFRRSDVFGRVFDAWGGLAAGLGPAVCFSLLWRRTTWQGVLAGMAAGAGLVQLWPWLRSACPFGPIPAWQGGLLPGFLLSSFLIITVSLSTARRESGTS